jgi:hypothetical protein
MLESVSDKVSCNDTGRGARDFYSRRGERRGRAKITNYYQIEINKKKIQNTIYIAIFEVKNSDIGGCNTGWFEVDK